MDIKLKERLIGVMVLISLAIIFLPSLFHRDQRIEVDRTTVIPPKPKTESIVIRPPVVVEAPAAPSPKAIFQPPVEPEPVTKVEQGKASEGAQAATEKAANTKQASKPALNEKGLPNAWVVQLGSFKSQKLADELKEKLIKAEHKAYSKPVTTSKGEFFRVFTGPYLNKSRAISAKKQLDKAYNVESRILTFSPE